MSTTIPLTQHHSVVRWLFLAFFTVVGGFLLAVLSPMAPSAFASSTCSWVNNNLVCSNGTGRPIAAVVEIHSAGTRTYEGRTENTLKTSSGSNQAAFRVPCQRWGGVANMNEFSGSTTMQTGKHCYIKGETFLPHIQAAYPGIKPLGSVINNYFTYCAANGDRPPVGKNIRIEVRAPEQRIEQKRKFVYKNPFNGKVIAESKAWIHSDKVDTSQAALSKQLKSSTLRAIPIPGSCIYANIGAETKYCYWGMALDRARYATNPYFSGAQNINHKAKVTVPFASTTPAFSKEAGPNPCSNNLWSTSQLSPDELGYYSMEVSYNWQRYTARVFTDSTFNRGGTAKAWTSHGVQNDGANIFAIHACFPGGSAVQAYNTQGALIAASAAAGGYMNPAACPQPQWECRAATNTLAGLDAGLYRTPAGRSLPSSTVLRNGENVPITYAQVQVIDQSNGGALDVTNGNSGNSVRNISRIDYRNLVTNESTPRNDAVGLNSANQYFQLRSTPTSNSRENFAGWSDSVSGGWRPDANGNLNKALSFNWASDGDGSFQTERQWRVSGEFRIPLGGNIQLGVWGGATSSPVETPSTGGNRGTQWQDGTYECQDYQYSSNGTRTSTGLLTSTSNEVIVVRSANSNTP